MSSHAKFNIIEADRATPQRSIGFGAAFNPDVAGDKKRFVGQILKNVQCPTYNMPTIDSVTGHWSGPVNQNDINADFGASINPLGYSTSNAPRSATSVDSTFAEPGKFQTFALITAIQWRLDPEPLIFTAKGNAITAPALPAAKPVSADDYAALITAAGGATSSDLAVGGALGLTAGQSMTQAILEWGWWQQEAFYYMTRGYNLVWQYGNRQALLNDSLRYTAYVPTNAQEGSASSSEVDLSYYALRTNNYYRDDLHAQSIFLMLDRARIGNLASGFAVPTAGPVASAFRPSRAYETLGATQGGGGVKAMLKGNNEFRRLAVPFIAWPGSPLGLKAVVSDSDDQSLMQAYLSASYGTAPGLSGPPNGPATFSEDRNIAVGASVGSTTPGLTGIEPSIDFTVQNNNTIEVPVGRTIFKGGAFKITVAFKGYELTPDQACMLRSQDMQSTLSQIGIQLGNNGL